MATNVNMLRATNFATVQIFEVAYGKGNLLDGLYSIEHYEQVN
jgi:hypothetical protein